MAFTAMKVLGVLQSSESGVSSIVDAALAPPVSIQYMFFQDCVFSELTDLLGERLNQNQSGFCNMTEWVLVRVFLSSPFIFPSSFF